MNDTENAARRALRKILEPIEPAASLGPQTIRRAKRRRAGAMTVAAVVSIAMLGGASWAALSLGDAAPNGRRLAPAHEDAVGPRLYLAGDGELWSVDLDGDVEHESTPELGPGDPPYRIVARAGKLVAWGYQTYLVDPELETPPRSFVDDSLLFIPSVHEDRVWVAVDASGSGLKAVREVAIDGAVTASDIRPPDGAFPVASLDDGLVLSLNGGYVVWDPRSDEIVYRFKADNLGPVTGNLITTCDSACTSIQVTDVVTGATGEIGPPEGYGAFELWSGAFSPADRTLAVPVRRHPSLDEPSELDLALVNVAGVASNSGYGGFVRPSVVEGSTVNPVYNFVAWSSSGEYVFFTGGQRFGRRSIVAYRLGDPSARAIPADIGDFYGAAAL